VGPAGRTAGRHGTGTTHTHTVHTDAGRLISSTPAAYHVDVARHPRTLFATEHCTVPYLLCVSITVKQALEYHRVEWLVCKHRPTVSTVLPSPDNPLKASTPRSSAAPCALIPPPGHNTATRHPYPPSPPLPIPVFAATSLPRMPVLSTAHASRAPRELPPCFTSGYYDSGDSDRQWGSGRTGGRCHRLSVPLVLYVLSR